MISEKMATLTSTTIRTALVDYRAELLRLATKFPSTMSDSCAKTIQEIDNALLEIEGNIISVAIVPSACKR